jgi:hypothetical protein
MGRRGAFLFYFSPFRFAVFVFSSFVLFVCVCVGAVSVYEDVSLLVAFCLVFGGLLLVREAQPSTIIVVEEFGFFVGGKKKKWFCRAGGVVVFFFCRTSKNKALIVFVRSDFLLSLLGFCLCVFLFCLGLQFHLLPPAGRS